MPRDVVSPITRELSLETQEYLHNRREEEAYTIAGVLWNHVQASMAIASDAPIRGIGDPKARPLFLALREAEDSLIRLLPDPDELRSFSPMTDYGRLWGGLLRAQAETIDKSRDHESQQSNQSAERQHLLAEFDAAKERLSEAISEVHEDGDDALSQIQFDRKIDAVEELVEFMSLLLPEPREPAGSAGEEVKTSRQWFEWAAEQRMTNASSDQCTRGPSFEREIAASIQLTHATVACLKTLPYRPSGWRSFDAKMSAASDLRAHQSSPTERSIKWNYPLVQVPRHQGDAEEGDSAISQDIASMESPQEGKQEGTA